MVRKVTFIVEPSEAHHDVLSIQDAFQQAIDFFNLLTDETEENVIWKLEMASTNTPFTCQGEPVDTRTWAAAHTLVEPRVQAIEQNFVRLAEGKDFDDSFPREKVAVAHRMLVRNRNGIGRSVARFSEDTEPVEISQDTANRYFGEVLAPVESLHSYLFSRTSRREVGSVDGRLVDIGTDYDEPALQLEEKNTGRRFWCRVSAATRDEIGADMTAGDVWQHKLVRVRGTLNYDEQGKVIRVVDGNVAFIQPPEVDLDKIEDKEFTEGYAVNEYLDRLRENEFG